MENIKKVLKEIKNRPALCIGNLSLERLSLYLAGYEHACDNLISQRAFFNSYFQLYVEIKYKLKLYNKHWSQFLSDGRTEEQAFELFYHLVEEMFSEWEDYFHADRSYDDTLKTFSLLSDEIDLLTGEIPIWKSNLNLKQEDGLKPPKK